MKNVLRYILSAMIMMVALSCVDELEGPLGENPHGGNKVKMTFSASLGEDSKVALIDGTDIWWTPGDQILVNGDIFDTMVQEPSRTASFVGETMSADKYHAVFAQSISKVRWEGSSYVINLPTYQASQLDAPSTYLSAAES